MYVITVLQKKAFRSFSCVEPFTLWRRSRRSWRRGFTDGRGSRVPLAPAGHIRLRQRRRLDLKVTQQNRNLLPSFAISYLLAVSLPDLHSPLPATNLRTRKDEKKNQQTLTDLRCSFFSPPTALPDHLFLSFQLQNKI